MSGKIFIFFLFSVSFCANYTTQAPTWLSSNYFRASNQCPINGIASGNTTGNSSTPTYTFTYSSALTGVPGLAYGIKNYRGNDTVMQQFFEITRVTLTNTNFVVQMQIFGITNLWLLCVAYLAVDPSFPHYLNTFYNVPLNYSSGNLVNVSTASTSATTFTEYINYTSQAAGMTFTTFNQPYSNMKIALYITSLWIKANAGYPVSMSMSYSIVNDSFYSLKLTLLQTVMITNIHFSMIIFDQAEILSSKAYFLVYQVVTWNTNGGFTPIPQAFVDNFIMAVSQFNTTWGNCGFQYQWEYENATVGGVTTFGVNVLPSTPVSVSSAKCGFNLIQSTVVYLQTWLCNAPYLYFNLTSSLCQNNCANYYYANTTNYTCQPCVSSLCSSCDNSNSTICLSCDPALNLQLVNAECVCMSGYFLINNTCQACSVGSAGCTLCTYAGSGSSFNISNFQCSSCNASQNYYINSSNLCLLCTSVLSNCIACSNFTACTTCDPTSNTSLNSAGLCANCPIVGCSTCGSTSSICSVCDASQGYSLFGSTCSLCVQNCTCPGYALPKLSDGSCSTICGDGVIITPNQQCDDANTIDGDGCSSTCQVQQSYFCNQQPSVCYLTANINISLVYTAVSNVHCNTIYFTFQISPQLPIFKFASINWTGFITADPSAPLLFNYSTYDSSTQKITLTYKYTETIQDHPISFIVNASNLLSGSALFSQLSSYSAPIIVSPNNNMVATHCDKNVCFGIQQVSTLAISEVAISYVALALSLFSAKIIGLELFGVLQLSFFVLSDYHNVNPILSGVLGRKQVNGFNANMDFSSNLAAMRSSILANGFNSQVFLSNFNIMFLLTVFCVLIGLAMYIITYIINKDNEQPQENQDHQMKLDDERKSDEKLPPTESKSQWLHRMSKYILKEALITFIMFNLFNLSFSVGLQIKYLATVQTFSMLCLLISVALVILMCIGLLIADKLEFGEYFDKFKQSKAQSKYILVSIGYRFILGLLLALLNEWNDAGIVFLFIVACFLAYILYFQPFKDKWMNYRSLLMHSTHFVIIFIFLYYQIENAENPIESSYLYTPAYFQVFMIFVCIITSVAMIARQFYVKFIKSKAEVNNILIERESISKRSQKDENIFMENSKDSIS